MKAELVFRSPGSIESVREGLRLYFDGAGFEPVPEESTSLVYRRGTRLARLISLSIEDWPTTLRVLTFDVDEEETGVLLRYEVRTGFHLVGALDRTVLEVEAAMIEDYLRTGRRGSVAEEVAPVRRPVVVATLLNMIIAVAIVTWIGVMGDYPLVWVAIAATAVAFLDGVVIMAFADLLLEGMRHVPRLREVAKERTSPSPTADPGAASSSA
ncbi:MAG: hypothetical protein CMJ83_11420 [Planctomycetes bacterium]|nr:hypothetical protein [Planctomycetota bacterium]